MDSGDASKLIILLILLVLSAFFSSAETCLTTVNKMRLKSMADEGNKKAAELSAAFLFLRHFLSGHRTVGVLSL
mgnify:CR=1 FL=1